MDQADELGHLGPLGQPGVLQHGPDPAGGHGVGRWAAEQADHAGVGLGEAEQQLDRGGLAGPVGAKRTRSRDPICSDKPSTAVTRP